MSNAYTSTASASLGGTVGSAGLVQKAYDRLVEFALRSQPLVRSVADKRSQCCAVTICRGRFTGIFSSNYLTVTQRT